MDTFAGNKSSECKLSSYAKGLVESKWLGNLVGRSDACGDRRTHQLRKYRSCDMDLKRFVLQLRLSREHWASADVEREEMTEELTIGHFSIIWSNFS